ncbi:MAG: AAA family ATPase [Syntrophales bacterium]|nr:AAA family ATPase [Syntrophales bacterium]
MLISSFVGHENAKLALVLNAIDKNCGGVLFVGGRGCGKSTLARQVRNLLQDGMPYVELPLNVTIESLVGSLDIEASIKSGAKVVQKGVLDRAAGGILYIDDINLLPPEILSVLLKKQGMSLSLSEDSPPFSDFIVVATMNPDEGELSPHLLDRFGMCVFFVSHPDFEERADVLRRFLDNDPPDGDEELRRRIANARLGLSDIRISERIMEYIVDLCVTNKIEGHRGEIFLLYASRAFAAFTGATEVSKEHVDVVSPFVFAHRKSCFDEDHLVHEAVQKMGNGSADHERHHDHSEWRDRGEKYSNVGEKGDCCANVRYIGETRSKEHVFEIGSSFKVRRFLLKKDRIIRRGGGRRTKTISRGASGRYIRSVLRRNGDIAFDATIRAAAPFQILRGRKDKIILRDEDLRFKQREKRTGHLVVFVVDGSGSMGVNKRMIETKGAIQSLLLDCYQKRDKVALVLFRKDSAEVVLPPTSSVEMAYKRLKGLPVGGKTPLSAGLLETYNLVKKMTLKTPYMRFLVVLITDGRANHSISGIPVWEELKRLSFYLKKLPSTDYIVIDTEDKRNFLKTDLAARMAYLLDADYYNFDTLKAEYLVEIVQGKKREMCEMV